MGADNHRGPAMGKTTVTLKLTNNRDAILAEAGAIPADQVRRAEVEAIVDTGAAMMVLPKTVADQLGLPVTGQTGVRYADMRSVQRDIVGQLSLDLLGRQDVFSAMVEPARTNALLGVIVLEALDFLVDPKNNTLSPRDPNIIITEVE